MAMHLSIFSPFYQVVALHVTEKARERKADGYGPRNQTSERKTKEPKVPLNSSVSAHTLIHSRSMGDQADPREQPMMMSDDE